MRKRTGQDRLNMLSLVSIEMIEVLERVVDFTELKMNLRRFRRVNSRCKTLKLRYYSV
jgi:hypothetical protein